MPRLTWRQSKVDARLVSAAVPLISHPLRKQQPLCLQHSSNVLWPCPRARCAQDLILKLLTKDPAKRCGTEGGCQEIMRHPFFAGLDFEMIRHSKPPPVKGSKKGSASNFEDF